MVQTDQLFRIFIKQWPVSLLARGILQCSYLLVIVFNLSSFFAWDQRSSKMTIFSYAGRIKYMCKHLKRYFEEIFILSYSLHVYTYGFQRNKIQAFYSKIKRKRCAVSSKWRMNIILKIPYHIYWTKMKTLHIYSSSKIALISSLRNWMKAHMKISLFWLSLARNTCTAQVVTTLEILFYKKEIEIKKQKSPTHTHT